VNSEELLIIERIKNGDQKAYRLLVDRNKDMVYSIALKIVKNTEEAEELAMDAFMKAFEKIDTFKGDSAFSTWIYRICYNLSLSKLRKKSLNVSTIEDHSYKISDESDLDALQLIIKEEKNSLVHKAIDDLDEDYKNVIKLFYFEDKKLRELADILKISEANAKVKLHRGRKMLLDLLESKKKLIYR